MTKVKKLLKKAFTLVELVVVVAIIAILSGVSVAAYVGITDRANKAADQDVVAQLNLQLKAEESVNGKNKTCFDAIKDCYSTGLNLEELRPSTKNSQFVWDQDNDRFAIINKDLEVVAEDSTLKLTSNQNHRWILSTTYQVNANKNSVYLLSGFEGGEINISTGFDTGINNNISKITLVAPDAAPQGDLVIRTNIVNCSINLSNANKSVFTDCNIHHYGTIGRVLSVRTTETNKYVEHGIAGQMKIIDGEAEITKTAKVYSLLHYSHNSYSPRVTIDYAAEVYNPSGVRDHYIASKFNKNDSVYSTSSSGREHISHHDFATVIDAKTVYQICKGCGNTLVNLKSNATKSYLKGILLMGSGGISKKIVPLITCDIEEGMENDWSIEGKEYSHDGNTTYGGLKYQPEDVTVNQMFCDHENIKYTVDSTDPTHFHIGTCEDCGYSFKDIHTVGNTCDLCNKTLHNWDATTHKCTEHPEDSFYKQYEDTYHNVFEFYYCNGTLKISGFNDAAKTYSVTSTTPRFQLNDVFSQIFGSSFKMDSLGDLSVDFVDATYIPYNFSGDNAEYIRYVNFPNTLKSIGITSFYRSSLTNFFVPGSVEHIWESAFAYCYSLESVVIPSNVTFLGSSAFYQCEHLSYVEIKEGLKQIGSNTFAYNYSLETLYLPSSLTTISSGNTFYECQNLSNIHYANTKAKFRSIVGGSWLFEDSPNAIVHCTDGDLTAATF